MTLIAMPSHLSDQDQVPMHCGEEMTAMPGAGMDQSAGCVTWRCFCGYRQDAPTGGGTLISLVQPRINKVALIAALPRVEKLQWELDAATFELQAAVGEAIESGASIREIAAAVDLDSDEVRSLVS